MQTPTRLGEPQTTFRLARTEYRRVVPWYRHDDPRISWALSEVSVRATRLTGAPENADIKTVKLDWPSWDRDIPVLLLQRDETGRWLGVGIDHRGNERQISYSPSQGLVFV